MKRINTILMLGMCIALGEWLIRVVMEVRATAGEDAFFIDFVAFWAAGKLFLAGEPMVVWDTTAFQIAQSAGRVEGMTMPWFYPPTWHLAMAPFGGLPFTIAYPVFAVASFAVLAFAMQRVGAGLWAIFVCNPPVLLTLMLGNNSVLFAGCMTLALLSIQQRPGEPWRAGALIAVLSAKPGLGLLIPLALAAARRWQVFAWTTAMVIALAGIATLILGGEYWLAFLGGLDTAMTRVSPDNQEPARMISVFAAVRYLGAESATALTAHMIGLAAMATLIVLLWRRNGADDWACAALMIAIALTSPHAFHYEQVFAIAGMAFAARAGLDLAGKLVVALIWLPPLMLLLQSPLLPHVAASPVLMVAFAYCVWRGLTCPEATPCAPARS